jgi:hypothetical protein
MLKLSNILLVVGIALSLIGLWQQGFSIPFANAECYTSGTYTCSGTNESCPSQSCRRALGTLDYQCKSQNGTTITTHYERIYQSYQHYTSVVQGPGKSGLKDPENKKCLFEYLCQCEIQSEASEEAAVPSCVGSNPNNQTANGGITVEIRQPDPNSSSCEGG